MMIIIIDSYSWLHKLGEVGRHSGEDEILIKVMVALEWGNNICFYCSLGSRLNNDNRI